MSTMSTGTALVQPGVSDLSTIGSIISPSTIDQLLFWPTDPSEALALVEPLAMPSLCLLSSDLSLSLAPGPSPGPSLDTTPLLWPLGPPPETASWFLAANTWEIDRRVHLHKSSDNVDFMQVQISGIQSWLKTWVATSGCPFIHTFLYGDVHGDVPAVHKMPSAVQAAFLAMSSYVSRTDATSSLVLNAVDTQAQQLLLQEATAAMTYTPSLLEQLARVQALVVYQVIGLFDGNAHARHVAEDRRTTLCSWTRQLYDSSRQGLRCKASPLDTLDALDVLDMQTTTTHQPLSDLNRTWHFWILAESIRRICIVADAIDTIYQAMQFGWRTPASSLACTARYGLWQAQSAAEWERCCPDAVQSVPSKTLCTILDLGLLLGTTDAADVDMFSRALMSSAYGQERVRQWERQSRGNRLVNSH